MSFRYITIEESICDHHSSGSVLLLRLFIEREELFASAPDLSQNRPTVPTIFLMTSQMP